MPVKKIKQKDVYDRFYTKEDVAKHCISILLKYCTDDDLFIEPSAGSGSFYRHLPNNKLGFDIYPACDGVSQQDFLSLDVLINCVIVGNPPFGTRNNLSKSFIKHSLGSAKIIAFVLPMVYKKRTLQSVFPKNWCLTEEIILPYDSFIFDGENYHVPCVFQIWIRDGEDKGFDNLRESVKIDPTTDKLEWSSKDESDWFMFGAAPHNIIPKDVVNGNNRGYYFNETEPGTIELIKQIPWKNLGYSSASGGVSWFTKSDIVRILNEHSS